MRLNSEFPPGQLNPANTVFPEHYTTIYVCQTQPLFRAQTQLTSISTLSVLPHHCILLCGYVYPHQTSQDSCLREYAYITLRRFGGYWRSLVHHHRLQTLIICLGRERTMLAERDFERVPLGSRRRKFTSGLSIRRSRARGKRRITTGCPSRYRPSHSYESSN